jgi:hypothetical protein
MKNTAILVTLLCLLGLPLNAQEYLSTIKYATSLPLADTEDYIDSYSWKGFEVGTRSYLSRNSSFGFMVGWNVFDKRPEWYIYAGQCYHYRYPNTLYQCFSSNAQHALLYRQKARNETVCRYQCRYLLCRTAYECRPVCCYRRELASRSGPRNWLNDSCRRFPSRSDSPV